MEMLRLTMRGTMGVAEDARLILNADGTIADANEAALKLYGASLDELRAAPAGAFSANPEPPDAQTAFRETWESEGKPDLVGEASVKRLDGTLLRVWFGITRMPDGRFAAILRALDQPTEDAPKVFTAGQVLAQWRAAERELQAIAPESPEASMLEREIDRFRRAYQRIFASAGGRSRV